MLGKKRERALLERCRAGDRTAEAELIQACMPLVYQACRPWPEGKIKPREHHGGLSRADAVQEGLVGLMTALRRFDPARGCRFTTFACLCIRNAVSTALRARVGVARHEISYLDTPLGEYGWRTRVAPELAPLDIEYLDDDERRLLEDPPQRLHRTRLEQIREGLREAG